MKYVSLAAAAPFLLAGCVETGVGGSAHAGLTISQKNTLFDEAVASIGCDLKFESDYLPVELQTGMTREELQQVAAAKVRRGKAVPLQGGGVRSTVGACADGATPVAVAPLPVAAAS